MFTAHSVCGKNQQNQGSTDKKFDFFPQSLSHIPRWVLLVQKTRAKNSHAWAPLSKLSIAQSSRKFCEWHTPHPPVATLGPEPANFQKNPKICGKTGKFEAYLQVACLGGGVPWRIFPKSADFLIILKLLRFKETFYIKKLL